MISASGYVRIKKGEPMPNVSHRSSNFEKRFHRAEKTQAKLQADTRSKTSTLLPKEAESGSDILKKAGNVITSAAAATAAAAVLAASPLIADKASIPGNNSSTAISPAAITMTLQNEDAGVEDEDTVSEESFSVSNSEESGKGIGRALFSGIIKGIKALTGFVLTLLVRLLGVLITGNVPFLSGKTGLFLSSAITFFFCIFLLLSFLFKTLFPDRSLKELWTGRNLFVLLLFSLLHASAETFLPTLIENDEKAHVVAVILSLTDCTLVFGCLFIVLRKIRELPLIGKSVSAKVTIFPFAASLGLLFIFRMAVLTRPSSAVFGSTIFLYGAALIITLFFASRFRRHHA